MGHDIHFLERLGRVATPEMELALSLYQDPQLVRCLLDEARAAEGAGRVAIALADDRRGPFLVVARDGHFVTCLGEGMATGDLPVCVRGALTGAGGWLGDMMRRPPRADPGAPSV